MASTDPQCKYQPLPHAGAFRTLTLAPSADDETIQCNLQVDTIPGIGLQSRQLAYEAVSYAWGHDDPTCVIRLGAWPIKIRDNLWQFLKQYRHPTENRTLWIDALCIDQSKLDERARQVELMDQIFKGAERVIVWLGCSDTDSIAAMSLIHGFSKSLDRSILTQCDHLSLAAWARRPYWSRTWVVQEFVLASDVLLVCGPSTLSWLSVRGFLDKVNEAAAYASSARSEAFQSFLASPAKLLMQQRVDHRTTSKTLLELLVHNQHTQSFDPRDRVYAMLGLAASSSSEPRIIVSYQKQIHQLVSEVIQYCRIANRDMVRFTHFLLSILNAASNASPPGPDPQSRSSGAPRSTRYTIPTCTVGTVLDLLPLNRSVVPLGVKALRQARNLRHWEEQQLLRAVAKLQRVDVDKLRSGPVLNDISDRTFPNAMLRDDEAEESPQSSAYVVVVFTEHCVKQEILLGVACGDVKKGDTVLYFLGYDVALSADSSKCYGLSGRLLLLRADEDQHVRDMVTQKVLQGYAIQSEAVLRDTAEKVELSVTFDEVLTLAH